VSRLQAACLAFAATAVLAAGGCGGGGSQRDATVSVYVVPPSCQEVRREVDDAGRKAGDLWVRVLCLRRVKRRGQVDLGMAGKNARRAIEDSTAVAFLEAPGPAARFSRPIVEAADIAWVETSSTSTAVRHILSALAESPSSPRKAVLDEVG
jgi:hypothetical protein